MNRSLSILAAGIALTLCAAAPIRAEGFDFKPVETGGQEAPIITGVLGAVSLDGVEAAIVDLNDDGSYELVARLHGAGDCTDSEGAVCRTTVLQYQRGQWTKIFDQKVASLSPGDVGFAGMRRLIVNRSTAWNWGGIAYEIDVAGSGTPIKLNPVPWDNALLLAKQFGDGALALFEANKKTVLEYAVVEIGGDGPTILAKLSGPGVCGAHYGCPIRVLSIVDGAYVDLLDGFTKGDVSIMPTVRDGWRDLMTQSPKAGFTLYGWSGARYGVAETGTGGSK